jgi:AbrB family looped-hinge helix DNA binding protein
MNKSKENSFAYATLTSKGQVTLPLEVRESLGVSQGDRLEFRWVGPGRYEVVVASRPVNALKGILGPVAASLSAEQIEAAIAEGALGSVP